ncbi:MAG: endo-1,4-beta-xylanase [Bacteroidales bacterium]|nr:endo-1,4-beta-xylanase [Bacteroidales bacterium]
MKTFTHIFLLLFIPFSIFAQGFKTDNTTGNLLDANGNNFIMKGMNIPLSWYQNDVLNSIPALRTNTGSNCLRIVVDAGYNGTYATPENVWKNAVQACIDNDIIPMVELHDWTGSTSSSDFANMANWFVTHAAYFKQPEIEKYILLNICNEWGTWQTANSNGTAWRDGFNSAVTIIRNAGIKTTLVIDAVGYGQDINNASNIKNYAASMINADPEKNLLFSVHMYCEWKKGAGDIPGTLQWMRTNKIPFIVGEFGYQHATDGSCDIDEDLIMSECDAKGIGWLAWSQKGNSGGVEYLDLCSSWNCTASSLSNWGKSVVNGQHGTKTAVTCSVFTSTNNPPTVSLTAPQNNASFNAQANITITATASDSDGTISKVEFYAGSTLVGTKSSSPYSVVWQNATSGTHQITAVAYDNSGATTTSSARTITVSQPANNTPPSCVLTQPHVNAYFQQGSSVTIRAYSTDVGGTYADGTVTKVEFYYAPENQPTNTTKLGEKTTHSSNTFMYVWENVAAGSYRITAKATDNSGATFTSAGVLITVGAQAAPSRGMSACKGKYLANIIPNSVRSDYGQYWNGVTAENSCKWGSVEGTRNVMNWGQADVAYNYARNNNLMFRYHALAWGSQYPQWITNLSVQDFRAEMEEYMVAIANRYKYIDQVDVLNENLYLNTYNGQEHAAGSPYFRAGLGGPGVTGYDWAIWLFEKARQHFPNSKLVINDFELENNPAGIDEMLNLVKVLRDRGLIDGFGTQAHCFNVDGLANTPNTLKTNLDRMARSGVPVYVTELDLNGGNNPSEALQLKSYQNLFPIYWDHPAVGGITLWGYVEGATWKEGTGLLNANGTKRSAMTWLENYVAGRLDVGYPYCSGGTIIDPPIAENNLTNGEFDEGTLGWDMQYNNNTSGNFTIVTNANMSGTNAAKVCPTNAGTENWHVQLRQNAPFEAGKTYEISFMAKADATRILDAGLQMEGDPWTSHWGEQQNLTTSSQNFNYTFSPTVTDATAKLKFYVGKSTTCVYIDKVVFKEASAAIPPIATITANGPTTFCAGNSVVLQASTGTGYTYQWRRNGTAISAATSDTYTATTSGSYTVVVTANAISVTSAATVVTVNQIPTTPTLTTNSPVCVGATLTLSTNTVAGATYSWSGPNGFTSSVSGISRQNASVAMSGTYTVTHTVQGCTSIERSVNVSVNPIPDAPLVTTPVTYAQNADATTLEAVGTAVLWYNSANAGTGTPVAPKPATTTIGTHYWYASQTVLGCESARAPIEIIITEPIVTQTISLQAGWNLISISIECVGEASKISSIFKGLPVQMIKNADGFWRASQANELNSLQSIESGKGYLVYMNTAGTLEISGKLAVTPLQATSLHKGWNMIGYPCMGGESLNPEPISNYFNTTNCEIVKNFDGFWQPNGSTNSIYNFESGKGYFVLKR